MVCLCWFQELTTALHVAAQRGHVEIVHTLIMSKAIVEFFNKVREPCHQKCFENVKSSQDFLDSHEPVS
jgi:hypothetical protein